ncbi:MAG: hypothetical protein A2053_02650 [Deltaproteobacteria bacterium GWA2_50_8]|nr:MAG: hypothetical protein A2053_02650 [Deltaproteobacteria bacterium GWA2_50_8]
MRKGQIVKGLFINAQSWIVLINLLKSRNGRNIFTRPVIKTSNIINPAGDPTTGLFPFFLIDFSVLTVGVILEEDLKIINGVV